jgi:predicted lipoprotein
MSATLSPRRTEEGTTPRRVPVGIVLAALLVLLLGAMVLSTTFRSASAPIPGAQKKFDAATFGKDNYASKVKPAVLKDPVPLTTLLPLVAQDADAAGEKYGKRSGSSSPYAYSVSFEGTAHKPVGGLMQVDVAGAPKGTRVSVQTGPAINGTTLRDATGLVDFNDFVNQVEYANAATALNQEMKKDVLDGLDLGSLVGKKVSVVGTIAPLTPDVITVTPVSLEASP